MIFLSTDCYHHQNKKIEVVLNQHALIGKTTYLLILELADQLSQMDQEIYAFIKPLFIHLHCAVIQKRFRV